jgi:hypothetical protein
MNRKPESEGFIRSAIHRMAVLPLLLLFLAVPFILTPVYGAGISISGTVKDSDGKAVGGADVYAVADPKVKTASGADGSFSLNGTIADAPGKTKVPVAAAKTGYMTARVLSPDRSTKDLQFKLYPSINDTTVTLMGNRMGPSHLREEAQWDNKSGKGKLQFVFLLASDGPPGIKAEWDQIWADYHPGSSIDGDGAKELEDQFKARLLYYIDGPMADGMLKADNYGGGTLMSITGTVQEKDGKKWITATATGAYKGPTYPERLMGPDKPLVQLPVKPGLVLKLTDALSDTLIYVPSGKIFMGSPLEQVPHWQEAPSHMVTLTKGFYLSDHPITNSEYAAVTGDATRNPKKNPDGAAVNISCEMFDAYVKALQKLNPGKVIRAPSRAEWEYVARSGTSNLSVCTNPRNRDFNFNNRYGETCDRTVAVKSKKPNHWGFYGIMFDDGSERTCDAGFYSDHVYIPAVTDPRYPSRQCPANLSKDHIHANSGKESYPVQELMNDNSNVGTDLGGAQRNNFSIIRQRVLVEE